MLPYLIWVPPVPFSHACGGVKVLYALRDEMRAQGQVAYTSEHGVFTGQWITIYPEIVPDNPTNSKCVVRWILYPTANEYPGTDLRIPFMRMFNSWECPDDLTLYLPAIDTEIFCDPCLPRCGRMRYIGSKGFGGRVPEIDKLPELNRALANNQRAYARALQTCEVLYTYDNCSAINECARLCGCPVVILPNGSFSREDYSRHELGMDGIGWGIAETDKAIATVDSSKFRQQYLDLKATFRKRLSYFIDYTQKLFA